MKKVKFVEVEKDEMQGIEVEGYTDTFAYNQLIFPMRHPTLSCHLLQMKFSTKIWLIVTPMQSMIHQPTG